MLELPTQKDRSRFSSTLITFSLDNCIVGTYVVTVKDLFCLLDVNQRHYLYSQGIPINIKYDFSRKPFLVALLTSIVHLCSLFWKGITGTKILVEVKNSISYLLDVNQRHYLYLQGIPININKAFGSKTIYCSIAIHFSSKLTSTLR